MAEIKIDLNEKVKENIEKRIEELEQVKKKLAIEFERYVDEQKETVERMGMSDFLYPDVLEKIVRDCKKYRKKYEEIAERMNFLKLLLETGKI